MKTYRTVAIVAILSWTVLNYSACTKKPTDTSANTKSANENTPAKMSSGAENGQGLPGAKGPRLERTGKPPKGIEITDVKVSDKAQASSNAPPTQQFATGTNKLDLQLELKAKSPPKNKLEWEIVSNGGKVALKGAYGGWFSIPSLQIYSFSQTLEPESGTFPDGPYQLKLMMDGQAVALLNWSVGSQ